MRKPLLLADGVPKQCSRRLGTSVEPCRIYRALSQGFTTAIEVSLESNRSQAARVDQQRRCVAMAVQCTGTAASHALALRGRPRQKTNTSERPRDSAVVFVRLRRESACSRHGWRAGWTRRMRSMKITINGAERRVLAAGAGTYFEVDSRFIPEVGSALFPFPIKATGTCSSSAAAQVRYQVRQSSRS